MAPVNPEALHEQLVLAGLPVEGVDSSGNVRYTRALTAPETTSAAAIIAAATPADLPKRGKAFNAARALAATVNGTNATALTPVQIRNLVLLLCAAEGWIDWDGTNFVINVH